MNLLNILEKRFFQDAADGTLERFSLLDAALIAGGVERPAQLKRYQEKLSALVKELRASGKVTGSPRCRAEAIFEFMHRRVLGSGYRLECTDLRTAIDSGQFNCISATVLFNCLAGEFNLEVCGLEIPGHAVSRVFLPDGSLDIETTCPGWFRLMHDPARQAKALAGTIGRVPNRDMSHARQVFAVQIAAMIYYNRGVDLLGQKLFAEAAAANAKALHLDPISTTARGNLLAVLNNWAIELGANGHHTEAVDLLRIGMAFDQDYEPFSLNYVHVHHQWVEDLCRQGQFEEALTVLAAASQQFPGSDYFRLAPSDVRRRWAAGSSIRAAEDRQ